MDLLVVNFVDNLDQTESEIVCFLTPDGDTMSSMLETLSPYFTYVSDQMIIADGTIASEMVSKLGWVIAPNRYPAYDLCLEDCFSNEFGPRELFVPTPTSKLLPAKDQRDFHVKKLIQLEVRYNCY